MSINIHFTVGLITGVVLVYLWHYMKTKKA